MSEINLQALMCNRCRKNLEACKCAALPPVPVEAVVRPFRSPKYDRVCQTCGAAIYQGVICSACWSARAFPPKNPNAPAEARCRASPPAGCSAPVASDARRSFSPCGGCSPESTSDYAACAGCAFNPDKPNTERHAPSGARSAEGR